MTPRPTIPSETASLIQMTKQQPTTQAPPPPQQPNLYHASIYSFSCLGKYDVRSALPSFHENTQQHATRRQQPQPQPQQQPQQQPHEREGSCWGLRSQLSHVADIQGAMTREAILNDFEQYATARTGSGSEDIVVEQDALSGPASAGGSAVGAAKKSLLVPPMLVHKPPPNQHHHHHNPNEKQKEKNKQQPPPLLVRPPVVIPQNNNTTTTTTDHHDLFEQQEWSCYGSTAVDYLVLKDISTGHETVAAVVPTNSMGVSVRSVHVDFCIRLIAINLGWLTVAMITETNSSNNHHNNNNNKDNDDTSMNIPGQEMPGPPLDTTTMETLRKTLGFTKRVATHMQHNVTWLYQTTQDDFLRRTTVAGQKILYQMPHTCQRTATALSTVVQRVAQQWWGQDDDDDNDDHNNNDKDQGRGGPRRR